MLANGDLYMEPNEASIELYNWLEENKELDPYGVRGWKCIFQKIK